MRWPSGPSMTSASTWPPRIASSVCSASARRARSSEFSASNSSSRDCGNAALTDLLLCLRSDAQHDQDAGGIVHVTHQFAQRQRQFLDQRRCGDELLVFGKFRLLVDIDDLKFVASGEMLFAKATNILDRLAGARRQAADIEAQYKTVFRIAGDGGFQAARHRPQAAIFLGRS